MRSQITASCCDASELATRRAPNSYPGGVRRGLPVRPPIPLAAGTTFRRRDPSDTTASCSPTARRSHATRPSAGRVWPDWEVKVSGSGDAGARRHETGPGQPPQGDQQLPGQRDDHDLADSPPPPPPPRRRCAPRTTGSARCRADGVASATPSGRDEPGSRLARPDRSPGHAARRHWPRGSV